MATPIEVELGTDAQASQDTTEDDPWQRASAALDSAAAQAAAAAWSLGSAFLALAEAGASATAAAAAASYQAALPSIQAGQAAVGEAWAQGSGWFAEALAQLAHKDSAPVLFLFVAALVTLRVCLWLCGGLLFWLPHRLLTVVLLPMLAIIVAWPRAAAVARVAVDNATAAVLAQPLVQSLGAEVQGRLEAHRGRLDELLEHPNVAQASVFAAKAYNASLHASAFVLATAGPHLHAARAKLETGLQHPQVESLLTRPHVVAVLEHEHLPHASGTLATALAVAVALAVLRCCTCWLLCGCGRRRPPAPAATASAAALKRARRAAAAKELEASKAAKKSSKKKAAAAGRLRGAGEAELRSMDDVSAPSVVRSALAPTITVLGGAWAVLRGMAWLLSLLLTPLRSSRAAASEQDDDDDDGEDGDGSGQGGGSEADGDTGGEAAGSSRAPSGGKKGKRGGGKAAEEKLSHPRLLATLKGFAEGVTCAAFDGSVAAAVSHDRTLRLWSGLQHVGDPQKPPPTPFIANLPVDHGTACSLSANGRNVVVATARARRVLAFSSTPKLQLRRDFPLPEGKSGAKGAAHPQPMCAALLAPSGAYIVTVGGGDDTSLKLWSLSGDLIATAANKQAVHFGAAVSADSLLVAVAAGSNANASRAVAPRHAQVSVYEVQVAGGSGGGGGGGGGGSGGGGGRPTGLSLALSVAGHTRSVTAVSFAHDCVHLALAARDGEWTVVRTDARARAQADAKEAARGAAPGGAPFDRIALSPFAKRLVGATANQLYVIDVATAAVLETVPTAHGGVTALCYSSDGLRALSGGEDGRLRVWRVEDDAAKAGTL